MAYKISFSKSTNVENKDKNPVKFINTFVFQFLNPKGVIASVIVVSTYLDPGENFVNFTTQIIILALIVSVTSITLWTFMGKFIRKFATNQKYINYMKEQITYDTFDKVDIRVGTVISVQKNEKARKPSLVVKVDFGDEIGIKQSSAQITHYYNEENLKGKQVIGVCNFPEKNIAGVVSQVLILGSIDKEGKVILVHPSQKSENGLPIA